MTDSTPFRMLFVCRHNAVRSQIAEALARTISHGRVDVVSAGIEPGPVPDFVSEFVSRLYGKNVSLQSKPVATLEDQTFDAIITLCDKSHDNCPQASNDFELVRWDFHHPDDPEAVEHLEIELSERIRVYLEAKHLI